jgi:hypothetical protein
MRKDTDESTNELLRVIAALLLRQQKDDQPIPLRRQIEVLNDLGLEPAKIGAILGRTNTYISKELSGIRKSRGKSK